MRTKYNHQAGLIILLGGIQLNGNGSKVMTGPIKARYQQHLKVLTLLKLIASVALATPEAVL